MSDARQLFGQWLLQQRGRDAQTDALIANAKADPGFPKAGDPDAVRARLAAGSAEGDLFDLIDDLEADWLAL